MSNEVFENPFESVDFIKTVGGPFGRIRAEVLKLHVGESGVYDMLGLSTPQFGAAVQSATRGNGHKYKTRKCAEDPTKRWVLRVK